MTKRFHFSVIEYLPPCLGALRRPLAGVLDAILGLTGINRVYDQIPRDLNPRSFAKHTLELVGVGLRPDPTSIENLPTHGACIVTANHPHGALDGLAMVEILLSRRTDVRVMANHLLGGFAELKPIFIGVDPLGGHSAERINFVAARKALSWLRHGGLLLIFPGGEVSSIDLSSKRIIDPPWDSGIGWLVEKSGAPVVPAFIHGRNSLIFQAAGLLHRHLRTALLAREMLNHAGQIIDVNFGRALDPSTLQLIGNRTKIAPFLQTMTYLIQARSEKQPSWKIRRIKVHTSRDDPIIPPVEPSLLVTEIAGLPSRQLLIDNASYQVWYAQADQIPWLLQEIGRLRELTFRQVGEGTGRKADLDLFDSYYIQLFVWDPIARTVTGGYRLGQSDRIIARYGPKGLYVHSLFRLDSRLTDELGTALELGRSFVTPEHQRDYSSLMLLWKGIGAYLVRHPHYRVLYGPVSISNNYHPVSQQIIVRFLQDTSMEPARASLVRPRKPFRSKHDPSHLVDLSASDLRIISTLLSTVEDDDIGVPVLLRQYLKLNGRILGFNVDPDFKNSIDCLLWVDLARTERALLRKYMGAAGVKQFLERHGLAFDQTAGN